MYTPSYIDFTIEILTKCSDTIDQIKLSCRNNAVMHKRVEEHLTRHYEASDIVSWRVITADYIYIN